MDRAWKSKASAVQASKPTMKKTQSLADSCMKSLTGFCRGSGVCHSVATSPYSLVMATRWRQRNRSRKDCLMVGMVPLAMGSAVESEAISLLEYHGCGGKMNE